MGLMEVIRRQARSCVGEPEIRMGISQLTRFEVSFNYKVAICGII
jgi:hypothetical protein